jgi:hypothetical protein
MQVWTSDCEHFTVTCPSSTAPTAASTAHASLQLRPLLLPVLLLQVITQDRTGHREPVRGALYNAVFGVVVSVDEGGTVCVWNLQVGWLMCVAFLLWRTAD